MKEHAYLGYKILSKIPFLAEAAEIVYAHQEKYDGTGYPRGLREIRYRWARGFSPLQILWTQ